MTKNCCPGFASDFPFNKDSAGFNFFTFTPYTLNFPFRARAAYQLGNVSNFVHRITYDQPTEKRSYLMQSVQNIVKFTITAHNSIVQAH